MQAMPDSLLDLIRSTDYFLILGHMEPDADCIGSQLALGSYLARKGKQVFLCSAGPFFRPEIARFENRFLSAIPKLPDHARGAIILLDCSDITRIGYPLDVLPKLPLASIDHHQNAKPTKGIVFIDPKSPSVTCMVVQLIEALGDKPTREESQNLFLGLMTDSGFFRYLDESTEEIFQIASRLVAAGASPKDTARAIYGGKSFATRQIIGRALTNTESFFDGHLLIARIFLRDQAETGAQSRDSDSLFQLLMTVKGCEASAVIREESENSCTVGLRAFKDVDVGAIAQKLGGGGHRLAAGLQLAGNPNQVRDILIEHFKPCF